MLETNPAPKNIFATTNPNYAIFLAIADVQEKGTASVLVTRKRTIVSVDLGFVNGPSRLARGFVHVIDGRNFVESHNNEFVSTMPVTPLFAIEVTPQDLTEPICIKTETVR